MGRKLHKETPIKIKTSTRRRGGAQCGEELQQFFACLTKSGSDVNTLCAKEIASLRLCAASAVRVYHESP